MKLLTALNEKFKFSELFTKKMLTTFLISFIAGPVIGMLYLGFGRMSLIYFLVTISAIINVFILVHFGVLHVNPINSIDIIISTIWIIGIGHCLFLSIKKDSQVAPKWYSKWYIIIALIASLYSIFYGFRHYKFELYNIPSNSMLPNINMGDIILVEKWGFGKRVLSQGEVILFNSVNQPNDRYIRRIIALPEDKIQFKKGILNINEQQVIDNQIEDFIENDLNSKTTKVFPQYIEKISQIREYKVINNSLNIDTDVTHIPPCNYFVLADNRALYSNSSLYNLEYIPEKNILGKVKLVIWNKYTYKFVFRAIN